MHAADFSSVNEDLKMYFETEWLYRYTSGYGQIFVRIRTDNVAVGRYSVLSLFVRLHFSWEYNSNSHKWHNWDGMLDVGWRILKVYRHVLRNLKIVTLYSFIKWDSKTVDEDILLQELHLFHIINIHIFII